MPGTNRGKKIIKKKMWLPGQKMWLPGIYIYIYQDKFWKNVG